jgi:hypothetical protein
MYDDIAVTFGHKNDTFHRHNNHFFKNVVPTLSQHFLQPRNPNKVHPKFQQNPSFYPFFRNCLGAIDRTHVQGNFTWLTEDNANEAYFHAGVRYHLKEFGAGHQRPHNSKELFSHRHALLRNHVERALGVLNKRFPILKEQR